MVGCHALEKYATNFCGSVVSIVLSNHPYIQVLAVFLNHIEKLLDKYIIEIIVGDLSYDQIKNLVLRRDTSVSSVTKNLCYLLLNLNHGTNSKW